MNNKKSITKNLKLNNNFYQRKSPQIVYSSLDKKHNHKNNKIKPPFKQGLYSYSNTLNIFGNNNNNYNPTKFYSYNYPNSNNKNNANQNMLFNINDIFLSRDEEKFSYNSSSLNLNKYKINVSTDLKKTIKFKNNIINDYNTNTKVKTNNINIKNSNQNVKKISSLTHYSSHKNINTKPMEIQPEYKNFFEESSMSEFESRRMIIEYIKILNKKEKNIKKVLKNNNISNRVLNQKYNDIDYNDYNYELLGEAKKELYLKNLDYSLSSDSDNSNNNINKYEENQSGNIMNLNNLNILFSDKENKKINILYFLCVPKIFNIINENDLKEKYIFLIVPDENVLNEAKESYIFQWRDMKSNDIENEFNLKTIKKCEINRKNNNRFNIEVEKEDMIENLNFEIETPSKEICNYYVNGINFLLEST